MIFRHILHFMQWLSCESYDQIKSKLIVDAFTMRLSYKNLEMIKIFYNSKYRALSAIFVPVTDGSSAEGLNKFSVQ